VVVVGLGGVGSHAAAMLLRCGVGKLRLIDFDQVASPLKARGVCLCGIRDDFYKPTKQVLI
jgi:tRNA A37 threonylcarbamoyladenosine dehydratase